MSSITNFGTKEKIGDFVFLDFEISEQILNTHRLDLKISFSNGWGIRIKFYLFFI